MANRRKRPVPGQTSHGAREEEPVRTWVVIDGAPGRSEHCRDLLPLVEQHRLVQAAQRGIGVCDERRRFCCGVEVHDRSGTTGCRGRLPRCARSHHHDRRYLCEQRVDEPRAVRRGRHGEIVYLSRVEY
jgi:hypothetical protein